MGTWGERGEVSPILRRNGAQVSKRPWGPDDQIGRLNWISDGESI